VPCVKWLNGVMVWKTNKGYAFRWFLNGVTTGVKWLNGVMVWIKKINGYTFRWYLSEWCDNWWLMG
jgi:hypothetical protein